MAQTLAEHLQRAAIRAEIADSKKKWCARHERPRGRGAADELDELAAQFSAAEKQHLLKFAN
jgi:hypothetical protein